MFNRPAIWVPLLAGGLTLYLFAAGSAAPDLVWFSLAALCAGLTIPWLHQLGHVLTAAAVGLKTDYMYFWPYVISREDGWKPMPLTMSYWIADAGPTLTTTQNMRGKLIAAILAGPLVSIAAGALAFYLGSSYPRTVFSLQALNGEAYPLTVRFFGTYLGFLAWFSTGFGILTLLPIRDRDLFWDGALLQNLLRKETTEQAVAQYALEMGAASKRPRDWSYEWIEAAKNETATNEGLCWLYRAYLYRLDRGELEAARVHLDESIRLADSRPALYAGILRTERVFLYAWLELSDFNLRAYYHTYGRTSRDWTATYRALATLHLIEGKPENAIEVATRGRDHIRRCSSYGPYEMSADLFDQIIERAFVGAKDVSTDV